MNIIRIFSYVCFGFSALSLFLTFVEDLFFVSYIITFFVAGVLLLALDKIIVTLTEIRDALQRNEIPIVETDSFAEGTTVNFDQNVNQSSTKSIEEISADLARLKERNNQ